jgi:ABC-type transport system substrate-binding protein
MLRRLLLAGGLALALAAPAFADTIKQGGTLTITYKDDFSTLDPAIGYDWANWSPIKSLFSRLLDYKPGTTEIVPDLANPTRSPATV